MAQLNALVLYKGKPAIVKEHSDDKYNISLADGSHIKVRDKDIEQLHPGPVKNFGELDTHKPDISAIREAWELLLDEDNTQLTHKEIASIVFGDFTPSSAYTVYCILQDGLYFTGTITDIKLRSKEEIETEEAKRSEKQRDGEERTKFLERCKNNRLTEEDLQQASSRFMQDVEALAYGKSVKSRTMKELGLSETPEDAHALLLKTGIWTTEINPHPVRFGISLNSVNICPSNPPAEDRRDLCHLDSFAIDSPWSNDPDDAVSIEIEEKCFILYVHVSDPASSINFDSPAEKEARDRGATLYLPETTVRMISDECLSIFALGLSEKSTALTFKLTVNENGEIQKTEIFPSTVKVRRLTYNEADKLMDNTDSSEGTALQTLNNLAMLLLKRRMAQGAVNIDLPDVHISIENGEVSIKPYDKNISAIMVRECMIAAGEGAGNWASERGLAMPYISQETELPSNNILPGYAGSMQLRKGMRPRVISTKPGRHQGLGLDIYTQVTSPLRRYTDLLAHMQIRAFLNTAKGNTPLSADEISARFGYSEAAAAACVQAERASDNHWKMVYLSEKKESVWNAAALEKKGNRWLVIIPALALETQAALNKDVYPNEEIKLILKSVNISRGEAVFVQE
ncbi:MAG: RNB domain-containing ribonuclease [Treponema sp.]|jgi:exoribonuclease-2|nr:RNB domain-containing ribonuclease [Treponema sp.]